MGAYLQVHIDLCICIYTVYSYLHRCLHTSTNMYIHIFIYIFKRMYVYIYIYVFAYSLVKSSTISLFVNLHWLYQRKAVHFRNTLSLKCL